MVMFANSCPGSALRRFAQAQRANVAARRTIGYRPFRRQRHHRYLARSSTRSACKRRLPGRQSDDQRQPRPASPDWYRTRRALILEVFRNVRDTANEAGSRAVELQDDDCAASSRGVDSWCADGWTA